MSALVRRAKPDAPGCEHAASDEPEPLPPLALSFAALHIGCPTKPPSKRKAPALSGHFGVSNDSSLAVRLVASHQGDIVFLDVIAPRIATDRNASGASASAGTEASSAPCLGFARGVA